MKKLLSAAPGRVAILVGLLAASLVFAACHGLGGAGSGPKLGAGSIYKFDGGMQDKVGLTPAGVDTNTAIFNPNTGSRFTK